MARSEVADEWLFIPTQIAFAAWGFEEQKSRVQFGRSHARPQPSDNDGWPFSAAVVTPAAWGGIEQGLPPRRPSPGRPRLSYVDDEGWIRTGIFPSTARSYSRPIFIPQLTAGRSICAPVGNVLSPLRRRGDCCSRRQSGYFEERRDAASEN